MRIYSVTLSCNFQEFVMVVKVSWEHVNVHTNTSAGVRRRTMRGSVESKFSTTNCEYLRFRVLGLIAIDDDHAISHFDAYIIGRCCVLIFRNV